MYNLLNFVEFSTSRAISKHIAAKIGGFCLFATHYHELTEIVKQVPGIGNLNVTALTDNNKLTMLYQVKEGVCEKSFGLHVAKLVDFPQEMIDYAEEKLAQLEGTNSSIVLNEVAFQKIKTLDLKSMGEAEIMAFVAELKLPNPAL